MEAVRARTSKLNKDEVATIGVHTERLSAVVMHLTLRLAAAEARAAVAEAKVAERRALDPGAADLRAYASGTGTGTTYAAALRLPRHQEPIALGAPPGPMLAFYPAKEDGPIKTADETKAALKEAVDPAKNWIQVTKLRKVGNAGVLVQTTDQESASRLRAAVPKTLRVTEPKRRQPLVCLSRLDGDPTFDEIITAMHEQNFRDDPAWPLARIQKEATGAFKKNRSRGAAKATAAILTCTAELREALIKRGRIYIGWQSVEVTDYVDVTCCSKCQQYGHPERYCRAKETTCSRCGATGHAAGACKAEETCCATCKRLGKREAAGHRTASRDCPARQYAEARSVSMTQYG
ncbi:hypothetical protein PYW07_012523 [Mythimna separata]|uniref:Gag-like protein n=1 Tax=Mythimna separata TaxID=271217 RepID=A0AAD8DKW3_MYTSE|nr:hypothetical protein PYW07_012523 [Mythimna separata]